MSITTLANTGFYRTSDLALVTALSLFYPIESIDKRRSTRMVFVFRRNKGFDELVESYWRGELRVEPQKFFSQLKIIKTRIYSNE